MSITKEKAWTIFRADKLGQIEGQQAVDAMNRDEFEAYESYAEEFDFEIAKIGVEAQNEAAAIIERNSEVIKLDGIKPYNFTANHYWTLISQFKGSKFETLHLSAMFGVPNNELLLELVKP